MTDIFIQKASFILPRLERDFDLIRMHSAAIVGNLAHECNGFRTMQEIKPTVAGSKGGYGWAQWTGPRRKAFEAWCAQHALSVDSDEGNYGYLKFELETTEHKAIPELRKTVRLTDAVIAFEKNFERAGVKHYESRLAYAERALRLNLGPAIVPLPPDIDMPDVGSAPPAGTSRAPSIQVVMMGVIVAVSGIVVAVLSKCGG
jgi:hypothetical protein